MKAVEKPAKRIFSQNKEAEKIVKTHKFATEKTLAQIVSNNHVCWGFLVHFIYYFWRGSIIYFIFKPNS